MTPTSDTGQSVAGLNTASRLAWVCLGLGLATSIILGLLSDGGYHDDGLSHYLYARWAWTDAAYLVDEWGRPGHTCLLFPFARLGWTACRLVSGLLSVVSAWLAWDIARRLGLRRAAWVPLLCFVQPMFLLASYTTLTETAAAFYVILAVWLMIRNRPVWSAALVSICFVTRYELLVFLPLWALFARRCGARWLSLLVLLWAPVMHNLAGVLLLGRWPIEFIVAADHPTYYGAGTALTMLVKSLATSGPPVAVLAIGGLIVRWPGRCGWLVPGVYGVHLLTHSLIFVVGAYASGGYPRFLVTTSPVAAVCAAMALEAILGGSPGLRRRMLVGLALAAVAVGIGVEMEVEVVHEAWMFVIEQARPAVWAAVALVLATVSLLLFTRQEWPGMVLFITALVAAAVPLGYLVHPHRISQDGRAMKSAAAWLSTSPHADAPVVATNIWASYFLKRGHNVVPPPSTTILDGVDVGTVFIWDANHSIHARFGITEESMAGRPEWALLWESTESVDNGPAGRVYIHQ